MSKQRKFVQQLTHGGYMSQKSVDNEVTTEDSFSNLVSIFSIFSTKLSEFELKFFYINYYIPRTNL